MNSTQKRTALITGASGGIGYELAKVFAREGYNLVLVARSEQKLNDIAAEFKSKHNTQVTVLTQDLAQAGAADKVYATTQAQNLAVDVLVNNAGFAAYGDFTEIELKSELDMMQLNMVTLTHLTKLYLPAMKSRGWGKILNVASTAAFQPGPLMAVYYATKAYVLSFSEAIARELQGTGVGVTALCPGPTESGFQQRAAMEDSKLVQGGLMSSAEVAEIGYQGMMKNQTVVIPGANNKVMAFVTRFMPRDLTTQIVMNAQQRVTH